MSPKRLIVSGHINSNSHSNGETMITNISIPKGAGQFGEWVIKLMAKQDMTRDDVANLMEVTPATVRRWMVQPRKMKIETLMEMAKIIVGDDDVMVDSFISQAMTKIMNNKNTTIKQHKNRSIKS